MNPIEFLKQNGYNPDNFRTSVPQRTARARSAVEHNHTKEQVRRSKKATKKTLRARDISVVRQELFNEWFAKGTRELNGLFLPYLMLDMMQQANAEYLTKVDFVKKERYHYTVMLNLYHRFNVNFFSRFTPEQKDAVIDMMDAISEYIHNELEIFRMQIMGCIMELSDVFRTTCGALCVCKLLISQSRIAWEGMYKSTLKNTDVFYKCIQGMETHITELMNEYFKRESDLLKREVQFSTESNVRHAEENVVKKILKFLKKYER